MMWKPGQSGNPSGRKPVNREVEEAAAKIGVEGIEALGEIMRNKDAPAIARVRAVEIILNRGFGMPRQQIDVTTTVIDSLSIEEQRVLQQVIEAMKVKAQQPEPLIIEHQPPGNSGLTEQPPAK